MDSRVIANPEVPACTTRLNIRIESPIAPLIQTAAAVLANLGHTITTVVNAAGACILRYRIAPLATELETILMTMRPFQIRREHAPDLDVDAVLELGDADPDQLNRLKVKVRAETRLLATRVAEVCSLVGCKTILSSGRFFPAIATLQYGGASAFARNTVIWLAAQIGIITPHQIKAWSDENLDLSFDALPVHYATTPIRQRVPITIQSDSLEASSELERMLRDSGFERVMIRSLSVADDTRLVLDSGVLGAIEAHIEIAGLTHALGEIVKRHKVDLAKYPLQIKTHRDITEGGVLIDLPLAAIRSGLLKPWSLFTPSRYTITIFDDDRASGHDLLNRLRALDFQVNRRRLGSITTGFQIRCGKKIPAWMREQIHHVVDSALLHLGADDFGLSTVEEDDESIEIDFPAQAYLDGRLLAELTNPARHSLKVITPSEAAAGPLVEELRSWGFRRVSISVNSDDDPPELCFGSAHVKMLNRISDTVNKHYGPFIMSRKKKWPLTDHDIFVRLPKTVAAGVADAATAVTAATSRLIPDVILRHRLTIPTRNTGRPLRPFLDVTETAVRIGDITLTPNPDGVGRSRMMSPTQYQGFCIDQTVADTLHFLARAVRGGYPAALEGPTAASKTWSIHFLAAHLCTSVYRLNLNAQSDASEVMGRFVPDTARTGGFRWQHGPAPLAMLEGAWLVLDEVDLAPTEILERCNSILEVPDPLLALSEFDGQVIRGDHRFRVMATRNGVNYVGRQVLSEAFVDRFKTRICQAPEEKEYLALGICLVHGSQPKVIVNGCQYSGGFAAPVLPELADVPKIDRFLTAFARFHSGLAQIAERGELRARGRIAFTRRAFVHALKEMRDQIVMAGESRLPQSVAIAAAWQAISFCYFERLDPDGERDKATTLLAACGIGFDNWDLPS